MRAPPLWYPAEPLMRLMKARGWNEQRIMTSLAVDERRLWELQQPGRMLPWGVADRYATRLGLHPVAVWPTWCADVADLPSEHWRQLESYRRQRQRQRLTKEVA